MTHAVYRYTRDKPFGKLAIKRYRKCEKENLRLTLLKGRVEVIRTSVHSLRFINEPQANEIK